MAITEERLQGIKRGLEGLDQRLPMAPTVDGRLPLHQDCRELLAEVERLQLALLEYGRHKDGCVFWQDDESDLEAYGEGGCCTCDFFDAKVRDA